MRFFLTILMVVWAVQASHMPELTSPHQPQDHMKIHLRHATIHVEPATTLSASEASNRHSSSSSSSSSSELAHWLVHLKGPITERAKELVNERLAPYALGSYIPDNTFTVIGPQDLPARLTGAPFVLNVIPFEDHYKIDPELAHTRQSIPSSDRSSMKFSAEEIVSDKSSTTTTTRLLIMLDDSLTHSDVHSNNLANRLRGIVGEKASDVSVRGKHLVSLTVSDDQHLNDVLKTVAAQTEVRWVERAMPMKLLNKFASPAVQSGNNGNVFWNKNLRGENQLIFVTDSGLDYDHCMFSDASTPVPVNTVNMAHRKIVRYRALGSVTGDDKNGHGTHVCGSVAADAVSSDPTTFNTLSSYNGVAPKAKLVVYGTSNGESGGLAIPDDLYTGLFKDAFTTTGASISTNSWGASSNSYSTYSRDVDRWMWDNKNFFVLFAAGNDGDSGIATVGTPATAKNCLAVGATRTTSNGWRELGWLSGIRVDSPTVIASNYRVRGFGFGGKIVNAASQTNVPLVVVNNGGCSGISNAAGSAVLVSHISSCDISLALRNAQNAGAVLLLVRASSDMDFELMPMPNADPNGLTVPAAYVTNSVGALLSQYGSTVRLTFPISLASAELEFNTMAFFSSRGPTTHDRRYKPEVVAPGHVVISARSDGSLTTNQCRASDLLTMSGTSMATPVVAGASAIVRQYFTEGYHPTGAAVAANSVTPSASLIKAILIASAESVGGTMSDSSLGKTVPVDPAPSFFQGWGRVQLNNVLQFAPFPTNAGRLTVVDNQNVNTGDLTSYCLNIRADNTGSRYFETTLAWTDYFATPNAAVALVNDLDLFAVDINTRALYIGNDPSFTDSSNRVHKMFDRTNNVEQIRLNTTTDVTISLTVRATNVPMGPQPYSLVWFGNVQQLPLSSCAGAVVCPNGCTNSFQGSCSTQTGLCSCAVGYGGDDCSLVAAPLTSDPSLGKVGFRSGVLTIKPGGWQYFYFDVTDADWGKMVAVVPRMVNGTDVDVYVRQGALPTLKAFEYTDATWDDPAQIPFAKIPAVSPGRYYVGVFSYLTTSSAYITVGPEPERSSLPVGMIVGIVVGVVGAVLIITVVVLYKKFCERKDSPAEAPAAQTSSVGMAYTPTVPPANAQ